MTEYALITYDVNGYQGSGHLGKPAVTFETFDDAEEFLSSYLSDDYEESRQEYEICEEE